MADWAVLLGPVSWDIYGARLVERYFFRPVTIERMVKARAVPRFGEGMFRYIPDAEHLAKNLDICRRAMNLAQRSGSSAAKAETQAVSTYYEMLDQLCRIGGFLAQNKEKDLDAAGRQTLQTHMNAFALASALNTEALGDWERAVAVGAGQFEAPEPGRQVRQPGAVDGGGVGEQAQHGVGEFPVIGLGVLDALVQPRMGQHLGE